MARRAALHEVEIVDDELDDELTDASAPAVEPRGTDRPRRRGALTLGAALVAVLVAVGVTGQVVVDRRDRARLAVAAAHPGSIPPLHGPPTALWEATGSRLYDVADLRTPDGLLVGVADVAEGPVGAVGLDAATGEEVWRVDLVDGATRPDPGPGDVYPSSGWCRPHGVQEHLAVCLAHDGMEVADAQDWRTVAPSTARLVSVDTRDGTVVTDFTAAGGGGGRVTSFVSVGDLVVVTLESTEVTEVLAMTSEGAPAWRTTTPTVDDDTRSGAFVTTLGDLVVLHTDDEVRLLDAAGATVRVVPLDGFYGGGNDDALYIVHTTDEGETYRSTVVRPEGDTELEGYPLPLAMDDGSVPDLRLTTDEKLLTARHDDGTPRWSVDLPNIWNVLLLDGRLHVHDGTHVVTYDARTGDELWRTDTITALPVTDGRVLLAVAASARRGHGTEMVALDPADGSELWRAPLPDGAGELRAHLNLLVAVTYPVDGGTEDQITVLG